MALTGFAYSFMMGSTFKRAQKQVIDMGFADDIHTKVKISGMSYFFIFKIFNYVMKETLRCLIVGFLNLNIIFQFFCQIKVYFQYCRPIRAIKS